MSCVPQMLFCCCERDELEVHVAGTIDFGEDVNLVLFHAVELKFHPISKMLIFCRCQVPQPSQVISHETRVSWPALISSSSSNDVSDAVSALSAAQPKPIKHAFPFATHQLAQGETRREGLWLD